jgi:hypothetical protein
LDGSIDGALLGVTEPAADELGAAEPLGAAELPGARVGDG